MSDLGQTERSGSQGTTPCHDCGDDTLATYWLAPDDLWQAVVGRSDIALCIGCFAHRANEAGRPVHFEAVESV